jgi:Peptidase C10 family.
MKKILLVAGVLLIGNQVFAKPVSVETAKNIGFKYLSRKMGEVKLNKDAMELVQTVESGGVSCYYVFNGNANSFVMVSADDQVSPVFAYSNEVAFEPNNIPPHTAAWLNNYTTQIKYVIDNNIPATDAIAGQWAMLNGDGPQLRTTAAVVVDPLLGNIKWGQDPYFNELCPFDADDNALTVTGCVATAMAQIMKYWNWPATGNGSYSYNSSYGQLTADFGSTTYNWNNMPGSLMQSNNNIATLMLHCGISARMRYGTSASGGSGAYVTDAQSPYTNCAEYAFKQYFRYDAATTKGAERTNYSDQEWIDLLKAEMDEQRPVLYAGFGSSGGHAWVADGYSDDDKLHINWGWNGSSNGYFMADAMNPAALGTGGGSGGFNNNQHVILGIQPEPAAYDVPDNYENNNTSKLSHDFAVNFNGSNTTMIQTSGTNFHISNDMDFFKVFLPIGDNYTVNARLRDKGTDPQSYSVDAKISATKNVANYGSYKPEAIDQMTMNGGGYIYLRVASNVAGEKGTYQLEVNIERQPTTVADVNGGGEVNIFPNPASNELNIVLNNAKADITITDMQGRAVQQTSAINQKYITMPVNNLVNGIYFVQVKTDKATTTQKVVIQK